MVCHHLSGSMFIFDTLCKRSLNFVWQCLNSENVLKFVSHLAVFHSRMCSGVGGSMQLSFWYDFPCMII